MRRELTRILGVLLAGLVVYIVLLRLNVSLIALLWLAGMNPFSLGLGLLIGTGIGYLLFGRDRMPGSQNGSFKRRIK